MQDSGWYGTARQGPEMGRRLGGCKSLWWQGHGRVQEPGRGQGSGYKARYRVGFPCSHLFKNVHYFTTPELSKDYIYRFIHVKIDYKCKVVGTI